MKKVLAAITILLAVTVGANAGTYTKPLYYAKTSDWDSVRVFIKVMNAGAEVDLCDSLITANDTLIYTLDEDSAYHGHEQWYTSGALFGQPSWTWDRQRTQANVVQLSGDATAADNSEYFFDGTGITQDLDIKIRSLEVTSDVGTAVTIQTTHDNSGSHGLFVESASADGAHILGGLNGMYVGGAAHGIFAATTGSNMNAIYATSTNGPGVVISGTAGAQITGTSSFGLLVNGSTLDIVGDISGDIIGTVTALDTLSTGDTIAVMPRDWVADDSAAYQGSASGLDTADIKTMIHGNFLPLVPDSPAKRYIYGSGDNTDGLTWETAWDSFDSIKTLTSPTNIWVGPGTYSDVACSLNTHGLKLMSTDGAAATRLRGTNDTLWTRRMVSINPGSDSLLKDFKIDGFSFAHRVGYGADDPQYKCAIWICDSVESVEITNCLFPADSNYKAISSEDDWVRYARIHDNLFAGTHVHAIDMAGKYGRIYNNTFFDMRDSASIGVRNALQIYTKGTHNAVYGNYIFGSNHGIAMNGADSNLIANNYLGLSVMSTQGSGVDNIYAGNYGGSIGAYQRRDDGSIDLSSFIEEEIYDYWASILTGLTGGNIFFSACQVSDNDPDSTDPAGWGASSGTVYLTARRYGEGYSRSLYIEEGSINTPTTVLDTGTYIMSADVWLTSATADTAFFQAYKASDVVQSWTGGDNIEYINGFTGWQKITQTIRLTKDTLYYFTVGANTGDSAYFANVCVQPFTATGNRMPGGHGGGIYAVDLYALDTLGTDSVRSRVKLVIVDATGERIDNQHTSSSGYFSFRLNDGTYTVSGYRAGYVFSDYELTVSGADIDSAAVLGYNVTITAATEPNTCTVYGYVYNLAGTAVDHATVTFTLKGAVNDTCSGVFMSDFSKTTYTDSDGLFEQALIYSSCLAGKKYDMVIEYADGTQKQGTFTVPDASTYEIPIE